MVQTTHRSNSRFDPLDYARTEIGEQYNHISDEGKPLFDESWIRRKQSLAWSSINNLELSTAAAPPILHYQHGKHQLAHCKRKKSWEHLLIDASWTAKLQKLNYRNDVKINTTANTWRSSIRSLRANEELPPSYHGGPQTSKTSNGTTHRHQNQTK